MLRDDAQLSVVNVMVSGDWAIVELRADATAKNGMRFDNSYCWLARFHDGKIVEVRAYLDRALVARLFAEYLANVGDRCICRHLAGVILLPHFGFNRFGRDASPHHRRANALIDRHAAAVSTQGKRV